MCASSSAGGSPGRCGGRGGGGCIPPADAGRATGSCRTGRLLSGPCPQRTPHGHGAGRDANGPLPQPSGRPHPDTGAACGGHREQAGHADTAVDTAAVRAPAAVVPAGMPETARSARLCWPTLVRSTLNGQTPVSDRPQSRNLCAADARDCGRVRGQAHLSAATTTGRQCPLGPGPHRAAVAGTQTPSRGFRFRRDGCPGSGRNRDDASQAGAVHEPCCLVVVEVASRFTSRGRVIGHSI